MTAPDSRDSVERVVAEMREELSYSVHVVEVSVSAFRAWADRLQALARGPQQAGGEDAKVRHLMKARDIALGAVQELQAEVARLQRERAELIDKLNGTPCAEVRWQQERERLQAALREAGRDAVAQVRLCNRYLDPQQYMELIIDNNRFIARLVRDGDSGEG